MSKPIRRTVAAGAAVLALGIGSAAWATSSASAAPTAKTTAVTVPKATVAKVTAPDAIPPLCTSSDLAVWISYDGQSGAAGTHYYPLEFTNTGDQTCRVWGWPGVSATNADGRQLGKAADRNKLYKGAWVNIAAGDTAHALLGYGAAEVSTSGCQPQNASALKVFAPGSKKANHAFFSLPVCTVKGNHIYLQVGVIQPGANI